jgi:hypothetical protein
VEYRVVEYSIAQGIDARTWKWTSSLDEETRTTSAMSRQEATKAVHALIDKALAPKKNKQAHTPY